MKHKNLFFTTIYFYIFPLACDCDPYGALTEQCDRTSGKCICNEGIGGYKCDECDRGYLGKAPYCETCGECFDNWDMILDGLKQETDEIIENAKKVKKLGATGAYKKEFDAMSKKIDMIQQVSSFVDHRILF